MSDFWTRWALASYVALIVASVIYLLGAPVWVIPVSCIPGITMYVYALARRTIHEVSVQLEIVSVLAEAKLAEIKGERA